MIYYYNWAKLSNLYDLKLIWQKHVIHEIKPDGALLKKKCWDQCKESSWGKALTKSTSTTVLPGGGKFSKITQKRPQKISCWLRNFGGRPAPTFVQKWQKMGRKIFFYCFYFFQEQFGHTINFLCYELGFLMELFLPKALKKY